MSFEDMPELPPLRLPGAPEYAQRVLAASRAVASQRRVVMDQTYGSDYWQKLDLYLPDAPAFGTDGLPVLLYFHGGAWSNGFKEWMGFLAPCLLDAPMLFVAASYRRAPQVQMPAIVDDCFAALAWVRQRIGRFGGDPERIFVGGHSAGGHLASLLALRPWLGGAHGLPEDVVKGCFPSDAPLDLAHLDAPQAPAEQQLAGILGPELAAWSPLHCLERHPGPLPPFHLVWGEHDLPRVCTSSARFVDALSRRGARVSHRVLAGLDHFTAHEATAALDGDWARAVKQIASHTSTKDTRTP